MDELPITISVQRTSGKGRGRQLGIPTFNFMIPTTLKLPYGIYAGYLMNEEKKYKAAIHFGPRPQFNEMDPSLEAYILEGHIENILIETEMEFVAFIRQINSFSTVDAMLQRIDIDINEIEKILKID